MIVLQNIQGSPSLKFVDNPNLKLTIQNSALGTVQGSNGNNVASTYVLIVSSQLGQIDAGVFSTSGLGGPVSGLH